MSKHALRIPDFVRVSVKALILVDNSLLVIRKRDIDDQTKSGTGSSEYLVLPGGGQNVGETLAATVQRECLEEIGVGVQPEEIVFVRDYIGANHEFADKHGGFHQMEIVFQCTLIDKFNEIGNGSEEDPGQIGIEWIPVSDISEQPLYPKALRQYIVAYASNRPSPIYLGDVN